MAAKSGHCRRGEGAGRIRDVLVAPRGTPQPQGVIPPSGLPYLSKDEARPPARRKRPTLCLTFLYFSLIFSWKRDRLIRGLEEFEDLKSSRILSLDLKFFDLSIML